MQNIAQCNVLELAKEVKVNGKVPKLQSNVKYAVKNLTYINAMLTEANAAQRNALSSASLCWLKVRIILHGLGDFLNFHIPTIGCRLVIKYGVGMGINV